MEISVEPMSYNHRLVRAIIEPVLLGGFIMIVLGVYKSINSLAIFLTISIVLLVFLRRLHWYKYYLKKVDFEVNQVKIEFYKYDKLHSCGIPNDQIKITKDGAFAMGYIIKLNFFQKKELLFYQYQVIGWRNREKILSIYSQFKKLDSSVRYGDEKRLDGKSEAET